MQVKLKRGNNRELYTCSHVNIQENLPTMSGVKLGLLTPGIVVALVPGPTLRLPEDGDSIYIMNDLGKTIDAYHWPPRPRTKPVIDDDADIATEAAQTES